MIELKGNISEGAHEELRVWLQGRIEADTARKAHLDMCVQREQRSIESLRGEAAMVAQQIDENKAAFFALFGQTVEAAQDDQIAKLAAGIDINNGVQA